MKKTYLALILVVSALVITSGCIGGDQSSPTPDEDSNPDNTDNTGSGNGDESNTQATSLDVTLKGYESGQITGGLRIRARELDQENPDLRVDEEGGDQVVIYNNDEGVGYIYQPEDDVWMEVSGTMADQMVDPFIVSANQIQETVADYGVGDTASLSYGDESAQWTKNAENPTFSDDIFRPPEGANIQENAPMQ